MPDEEANIGGLLDRVSESMSESGLAYQVVVVDDGSRDRTFEVLTGYLQRMPLTISRRQINQGLGATIRDGLLLGLSLPRRLVSYGASWLFRILFPTTGVRDYTCGFRAYRSQVLTRAATRYGDRLVEAQGFQCMVDILLKLHALDLIFGETPMILRYDFKLGASKMRVARTIGHTLSLLLNRRLGLQAM